MEKTELVQFVKDYIETWSTTNLEYRKLLIDKLYSSTAKFYANEPGDNAVEHNGLNDIFKNITQVNERLVVNNGLITESTGYSKNHDALKVTWEMKKSSGEIVMKGINLLHLDKSCKILQDYIFIG